MHGFNIFIEKEVTNWQLKNAMKEIFPALNFYDWDIQENIIEGEKDKELRKTDILLEITTLPGIFKTLVEFYRFPDKETSNYLDLFIGTKLSIFFNCKTTIDGYSYCDFDQMPDYSLLLESGKAYLIIDCYPEKNWSDNDKRVKNLEIKIIQEIDISKYQVNYGSDALKQ